MVTKGYWWSTGRQQPRGRGLRKTVIILINQKTYNESNGGCASLCWIRDICWL